MKIYGKLNRTKYIEDNADNMWNAPKTSDTGTKHSSVRSTKRKRRLRTLMNKRTRQVLKQDLKERV